MCHLARPEATSGASRDGVPRASPRPASRICRISATDRAVQPDRPPLDRHPPAVLPPLQVSGPWGAAGRRTDSGRGPSPETDGTGWRRRRRPRADGSRRRTPTGVRLRQDRPVPGGCLSSATSSGGAAARLVAFPHCGAVPVRTAQGEPVLSGPWPHREDLIHPDPVAFEGQGRPRQVEPPHPGPSGGGQPDRRIPSTLELLTHARQVSA